MTLKASARDLSLALTTGSLLLGLANIGLGRRVNYLDHLTLFNLLALTMLVLAASAVVVATVPLVRSRGRGASLWMAAILACGLIGTYLLDD